MDNEPAGTRPPAAHGRAYPCLLEAGLRQVDIALVDMKHMGKSDIAAYHDIHVAGVKADRAIILSEPAKEIEAHGIVANEALQRWHHIEINNVGRIERHEPVDVLHSTRHGTLVENCSHVRGT